MSKCHYPSSHSVDSIFKAFYHHIDKSMRNISCGRRQGLINMVLLPPSQYMYYEYDTQTIGKIQSSDIRKPVHSAKFIKYMCGKKNI